MGIFLVAQDMDLSHRAKFQLINFFRLSIYFVVFLPHYRQWEHKASCIHYNQYLNCRGNVGRRVPDRELASPPSRFSLTLSRFSVLHRGLSAGWTDKQGAGSTNKSHEFRPHLVLNCGEDFFLVFTWFRGQKLFNFRWRPFSFLIFTRFRGQRDIISINPIRPRGID